MNVWRIGLSEHKKEEEDFLVLASIVNNGHVIMF